MDNRNYTELYAALQKETTILTAQIRALYRELDRKFHLRGAQIPIMFGFETDTLGSYTRAGHHEKEHFHFSLLFVGYGGKKSSYKRRPHGSLQTRICPLHGTSYHDPT